MSLQPETSDIPGPLSLKTPVLQRKGSEPGQTQKLVLRFEVDQCWGGAVTDVLVVFRGADDGNGLRQHQLVRTVGVEVHAGQEGRLSGMSLKHKHGPEISTRPVSGFTEARTQAGV